MEQVNKIKYSVIRKKMKTLDLLKILKEEKGGYIIEASVTLPIVILAIVTISSLISIQHVKENIYHSASEELRYSMIASCVYKDEVMLPIRLEKRLEKENNAKNVSIGVRGYYVGANKDDTNDLIKFYVFHKTDLNLPLSFKREYKGRYKFVGRKFTGDTMKKRKLGFDIMENKVNNNIVYVFPQKGERYHEYACNYLIPETDVVAITPLVKLRYEACNLCNSEKMHMGSTGYIFPEYGNSYHRKSCQTVKKKL